MCIYRWPEKEMSGSGGIERRQVVDRRQVRSSGRDLYERLEEKRHAVDLERRHQIRRQAESCDGDPHGSPSSHTGSPEDLKSRFQSQPEGSSQGVTSGRAVTSFGHSVRTPTSP